MQKLSGLLNVTGSCSIITINIPNHRNFGYIKVMTQHEKASQNQPVKQYFTLKVAGDLASEIRDTLNAGDKINITGELDYGVKFKKESGHESNEIVVNLIEYKIEQATKATQANLQLLESGSSLPSKTNAAPMMHHEKGYTYNQAPAMQQAPIQQEPAQMPEQRTNDFDDFDDDLPF